MQDLVNGRGRCKAVRNERGIAAIAVALSMVALLVASGMVLDFGLVRIDRQVDKSAADAAVGAGVAGLGAAGDGKAHPYVGVCSALRDLRVNDQRFGSLTSTAGSWTDGGGVTATGNGCTDTTLQGKTCNPGDPTSWARFTWQDTPVNPHLQVEIQSGYQLSSSSGWREDALPAAITDQDDSAQGCNQLEVTITQKRAPGVGSIARASDLVTSIRSVGRVKLDPGSTAPAMLLLKRTGCTSLEVGSTAGSSWVHVLGAVSTNGLSQAGSIHADADGSSCSTSVYYGKANNGIIAYAAPLLSNPGQPDPTKPGQITSVAQNNNITSYDAAANVYASTAVSGTGPTHLTPTGRGLVTRKLVDDRYLSGVQGAMSNAQSYVFGSLTPANAAVNGYRVVPCAAGGTITDLGPPALTPSDKLYVDCNNLKSMPATDAGTVVFNGTVSPSATISLPSATRVYIFGPGDAINLGNGNTFSMHTTGHLNGANTACADAPIVGKAALFIKDGDIKETGGLLQLCNTSVFMMGGRADGCTPTLGYAVAPAPTQFACPGSPASGASKDMGTGQITQTGGGVDWTAPNEQDVMTLANGDPDPAKMYLWSDPNGPEDLALWDESAGTNSNPKYQFTGGGTMHMQGVFMVPNADPVSLSGSANFTLTNAQFVATSLALASNNTTLTMAVDPNAAVTLPKLVSLGLVR